MIMKAFELPASKSSSGGTVYLNELDKTVTYSWNDRVGENFLQAVKDVTHGLGYAQDGFFANVKKLDVISGEEQVYESREFEFERKYKV